MVAGDWLKERTTHAYAFLGFGVALIFGTPALSTWLYPHSTPFWVPGAFTLGILGIIFGVLMLAAPGLARLAGPHMPPTVVNEAPPPAPVVVEQPKDDPLVAWLQQQVTYLRMFDQRIPVWRIEPEPGPEVINDLDLWRNEVGERLTSEGYESLRSQLDSPLPFHGNKDWSWPFRELHYRQKILNEIIAYLKNDPHGGAGHVEVVT